MRKSLFILVVFLSLLSGTVLAPPSSDNVVIQLPGGFTPPSSDNVVLVLGSAGGGGQGGGAADSCTYSGNGDFEVNCVDNCTVNAAAENATGNFFVKSDNGNGEVLINASVAFNFIFLEDGCLVTVASGGKFI